MTVDMFCRLIKYSMPHLQKAAQYKVNDWLYEKLLRAIGGDKSVRLSNANIMELCLVLQLSGKQVQAINYAVENDPDCYGYPHILISSLCSTYNIRRRSILKLIPEFNGPESLFPKLESSLYNKHDPVLSYDEVMYILRAIKAPEADYTFYNNVFSKMKSMSYTNQTITV